ncbi:MAG: hypothetical protein C4305_06025 [Thermoleophilia bacterium]
MLVAAVLRPQQGEDGQLKAVGLAAEENADTLQLPVGKTEGAVELVFCDCRQIPQSIREERRSSGGGLAGEDGGSLASLTGMTRGYVPLLLVLSAAWGASYLFIKVGVRDFAPTVLMDIRLLLSSPFLFTFLCLRGGGARRAASEVRAAWREGIVLGIINAALPFTLIAWGEKHVDSGVAAIANASVPIFVALLAARYRPSERARGARLLGIAVGLVGVGVLAGVRPEGGLWAVAGTLAVVAASVFYAGGALYGQARTSGLSGPVLATATTIYGGLVLLPFALAQLPGEPPGWKPLASAVALSLVGTAFAQLVLFRMLRLYGASRVTLVTYLLPPAALAYGALLLDEPVTVPALVGLILILLGVALGSGLLRLGRRPAVGMAP